MPRNMCMQRSDPGLPDYVLLCDGDLAGSAGRLGPLVDAVRSGKCDLAVAMLAKRVGGGFGGKESQSAVFACLASVAAHRLRRPVKRTWGSLMTEPGEIW